MDTAHQTAAVDALSRAATLIGIHADTLPPPNYEAPQGTRERPYVGDLTDAEFDLLAPYLPPEPRQGHYTTNRHVLDALIWTHRTRRKRSQLPARFGTLDSTRKRSERWGISGVWDRLLELLPALDLEARRRQELAAIAIVEARRGQRIRTFRNDPNATAQPRGRA